jgi:hypothetical protein
LIGEKAELIKIAEEHALCQQEKAEWQQKLDRIEVILSENEYRYSNERQELESKMSVLQEEKAQLEARQSVLLEKPKEEFNIDEFKQNEEKLRN